MDIINLVTYIQEWLFLHHELLPYDAIIRETIPAEADERYKHLTLSDVQYDFAIAGKLAALSNEYPRILMISETLNAMYLVPRLSSLAKDVNVTVLELWAGISGYMNKAKADTADIAMIMPHAHVLEAYDRDSLMSVLQQSGKNYIRIMFGETHKEVFENALPVDGGVSDLREKGFEGVAGTVIAPGGTLINAIHALQHLKQEGKFFDLFALTDYDFSIGKSLKESIIKTENVIVLLDQLRRTQYESVVKAKLRDAGLVDTQIHFVYPNIDKINTILPEYLWEQANRDSLGIAEKINSIH